MNETTGAVYLASGLAEIGKRYPEDYVEIGYLSVIIVFGLVLNTGVFVQLMRQSRTPTASTSFLTGPYQLSSFNLFKVHLCITDFGILLVHALGKLIWLYTLEWHMGGYYGCKAYQFLSAFTYYANSNVVVSIGLDRLKVVYTSHIQGATSVRRVRWMLAFSWMIAAICALPQLYVWQTIIFSDQHDFQQCTTIWQIASHTNQSNELLHATQIFYEACHEAVVFWIPFFTLLGSYLLIVVRVLHYTLHPISSSTSASSIRRAPARCQAAAEGRLLISSFDTLPTDYYSAYLGNATEMTMLSGRGESAHSSPKVSVKSGTGTGSTSVTILTPDEPQSKRFRLFRCGCWKRIPRNCDCLLSGKEFSERIIERKVVCCGTSRACCLNAETSGPKFRPLGVRTPPPSGSPVWRRQLRSRIFITSLAIVTCHFLLWLPYNLVNMLRFIHADVHTWLASKGAHLLEDLIVLNSVLNPILYAYEPR